jgi:hypothetical protein
LAFIPDSRLAYEAIRDPTDKPIVLVGLGAPCRSLGLPTSTHAISTDAGGAAHISMNDGL